MVFSVFVIQSYRKYGNFRGGSRGASTSKMERFVIIVNGFQRFQALYLGCCSSPRSASKFTSQTSFSKFIWETPFRFFILKLFTDIYCTIWPIVCLIFMKFCNLISYKILNIQASNFFARWAGIYEIWRP